MPATNAEFAYNETINVPETEEFIAGHCEVYTDTDGHFITIETDSYEGQAMMTLPLAIKVHEALGKAIRAAQHARKDKGVNAR